MKDKLKVTIKIADVEPVHFDIDRAEEPVYRKAAYHLNKLWANWREVHKQKSSHEVLALVALAFAELYYRKSDQLQAQSEMIDDFEHKLDEILLKAE